jgi:glycosyltransferase involved in cell wall biosynthesis
LEAAQAPVKACEFSLSELWGSRNLSRTVVIAANSSWNIVTFRQGLIRAIREAGYEPLVVASVDAAAEERMASLGVERIPVDIERSGLNPLADLRLLLQYRRILKQRAPAAFLGFTIKPNIYGTIAASSAGIPVVANVSGLGTVFLNGGSLMKFVILMYRFALRRANLIFFQNPEDRELFVNKRIVRREQTRVLPGSGIDLRQYGPAPLPDGPPTFLLIARLLGDKGVREYAEAARSLGEVLPGAKFQLLGPLDHENRTSIDPGELDQWVAEGAVEYLGSSDDVRPFIERASVVVLPSYREGLPRSLLEGAAMGRPLIATDVPGCRELVQEGVNGLLCGVRDPVSLAGAMLKLGQMSAEQRRIMGQAARTLVEERFSEDIVLRAYLDALAELAPAALEPQAKSQC